MEVERALADLAEVRDRLAAVQRFPGYSAPAAAASGVLAVFAGFIQQEIAPAPAGPAEYRAYVLIWFACLGAALVLNYGAIALWFVHAGRHGREQTKTVGLTILPSLGLGAVLSAALIDHGLFWMLPGVWFASYAVGLFASRALVPAGVMIVAAAFALMGAVLLLSPQPDSVLSWWVMPLGFGAGQIVIGAMVWHAHLREAAR